MRVSLWQGGSTSGDTSVEVGPLPFRASSFALFLRSLLSSDLPFITKCLPAFHMMDPF